MAVYVDELKSWGWVLYGKEVKSCHMIADSDKELHELAEQLKLKRAWAQKLDHPNQYHHHYDLTKGKRAEAVKAGATEITSKTMGLILVRRSTEFLNLEKESPLKLFE